MRAVLILSRAIAKGSLLALNIQIPSQDQTLEGLGGGGGGGGGTKLIVKVLKFVSRFQVWCNIQDARFCQSLSLVDGEI